MIINDRGKHPGVPQGVTYTRPPVILGIRTEGRIQTEAGGYDGQVTAEENGLNGASGVRIR